MSLWIPQLTKAHRAALSARLGELPKAERRSLITDARRDTNRDRRVRIPIAVSLAALTVGGVVPFVSGEWPLPWRIGIIETAYAVLTAATVWASMAHSRLIDRAVAAEFPTLCPTCGYDRRATPDRCPECGAASSAASSAQA